MTGTRVAMRRFGVLLLALLAAAPAVHADEPPVEAPGDFRNGQANSFGEISMAPYLAAGDGSVPVEARIVLLDMAVLHDAADVLLAFNLKSDSAKVELESVRTASGQVLVPTSTVTVDGGRQPQAHIAPADLLAAASGGRVELVLAGRVEAKANGQSHLGAMAMAFDEAWDVLPLGDGSAMVYGFTMVMATGIGGGAMPFQGQGNTWLVLPVALPAFVVGVAGVLALRAARNLPAAPLVLKPAAAHPPLPGAGPAQVAVFGSPHSPTRLAVLPLRDGAATPPQSTPVPTPISPVAAGRAPLGPRQGPLLPPHPLHRSGPQVTALPSSGVVAPGGAAVTAIANLPPPPASGRRAAPRKAPAKGSRPAARPPARARPQTRPKAKAAAAGTSEAPAARRQASR